MIDTNQIVEELWQEAFKQVPYHEDFTEDEILAVVKAGIRLALAYAEEDRAKIWKAKGKCLVCDSFMWGYPEDERVCHQCKTLFSLSHEDVMRGDYQTRFTAGIHRQSLGFAYRHCIEEREANKNLRTCDECKTPAVVNWCDRHLDKHLDKIEPTLREDERASCRKKFEQILGDLEPRYADDIFTPVSRQEIEKIGSLPDRIAAHACRNLIKVIREELSRKGCE